MVDERSPISWQDFRCAGRQPPDVGHPDDVSAETSCGNYFKYSP